jgi:hypothetical protein
VRRFTQLLAQLTGALVCLLNFRRAVAFGALHRGADRKPELQLMFKAFVTFGQPVKNSQARRKMLDCFARRAAAERIASSLFAIPECALEITSLLEMARQLRRDLIRTIAVRSFLPLADAIVQSRSARRSKARVNGFAV